MDSGLFALLPIWLISPKHKGSEVDVRHWFILILYLLRQNVKGAPLYNCYVCTEIEMEYSLHLIDFKSEKRFLFLEHDL